MSMILRNQPRPLKLLLWFGLPVVAAVALLLGGADALAGWEAKNGRGIPGTFAAERQECRRACSFHGSWTAADGSRSRPDVILYDAPSDLSVGGTTPALDPGARKGVFATAGGNTYLIPTAFALAGLAIAAAWLVVLLLTVRPPIGRRTSRST